MRILSIISALMFSAIMPWLAFAHGFGQRIDLPIPLNNYLIGGSVVVAASFIFVAVMSRKEGHFDKYPRYNLLQINLIKLVIEDPVLLIVIRIFFVFLLALVIAAGFIGKQSAASNITPTFVWILFGVGMTYFSAFIGNIWPVINPWKTVFEGIEKLTANRLVTTRKWPTFLGVWPAAILFFVYRWVENAYPNAADPLSVSVCILMYSVVMLGGMFYFGKNNWLRYGDPFSVFFEFLSRCSITEARVVDGEKALYIRPPGAGILKDEDVGLSEMVFVLFMLSSIAFDGIIATPIWLKVDALFYDLGLTVVMGKTIGLLLLLLMFVVTYLTFSTLIAVFSENKQKMLRVAFIFVLSLLPIAVVYEVAHFVTLLFIEGQRAIALVSDPFGFGWDLFKSAGYEIDYKLINLRSLWHWQVFLIVFGHVVSVYVAHVVALHFILERKLAIRSQYPMMVLMIVYTNLSLWILAQPITVEINPYL